VEASQRWLDEIENMVSAIAASIPNIEAYLKTISEENAQLLRAWNTINERIDALANIDYLTETGRTSRVYVKNSLTALPKTPLAGRKLITIYNHSSRDVYFGFSGVTGGIGMVLRPGQPYSANAKDTVKFYGVISAGGASAEVRILEGKCVRLGVMIRAFIMEPV